MASQAVRRIVKETPGGLTTLELLCGCVIEATLDENRLITADDGARIAIGKYPCPLGHRVTRALGS